MTTVRIDPIQALRQFQRIEIEAQVGWKHRLSIYAIGGSFTINPELIVAIDTIERERIGSVRMRRMSNAVWISEDLYVKESYRGEGMSKALFVAEKRILRFLGGRMLIATVKGNNDVQIGRLEHLGWRKSADILDDSAKADGAVWTYNLTDEDHG